MSPSYRPIPSLLLELLFPLPLHPRSLCFDPLHCDGTDGVTFEGHVDIPDPRVPATRYSAMFRDRLEGTPSPLAVLRMSGETVRNEERFDSL